MVVGLFALAASLVGWEIPIRLKFKIQLSCKGMALCLNSVHKGRVFMKKVLLVLLFVLPLWSPAQEEEIIRVFQEIQWVEGPSSENLGYIADIDVPEGFVFADGNDTRRFLEVQGNLTSGTELGLLLNADDFWFITFEFSDVGYIKDDEKDSLDADAMLESIKEGTEQSNKNRIRMGFGPLRVIGWEQKPHYNENAQSGMGSQVC